ncbi:toprim domain-containing protein [Thomasclavelia cocleata]|uniref:toprim domain-containing protein n=2 Tax=Thomasclavelia cocleata TaxID=69824 RepID=UPI00242F89A7|nr:toprim domain-containing protein [Thomasclavelia cocleata]
MGNGLRIIKVFVNFLMQYIWGKDWKHENYLALAGATVIGKNIEESELPLALEHFLMSIKQIKEIILHLDNDRAGYETSEKIKYHLSEKYEIIDESPRHYKDMNEILLFEMSSKHSLLSLSISGLRKLKIITVQLILEAAVIIQVMRLRKLPD